MLGRLFVVFTSEKEEDYQQIKEELMNMYDFSISPYKESTFERHASEFFATFTIKEEDVQPLLDKLNNDWDGEYDDCIAYGFNTKMFNSLVYYLSFQLYD